MTILRYQWRIQASEEAQAKTRGKKSSTGTIPHDIPNLRGKINNLEVLSQIKSPDKCLGLPLKSSAPARVFFFLKIY
jgi:transposase-like protein